MKIFLAGQAPWKEQGLYDEALVMYKPFILESFFYANEITEKSIPIYSDFLLDSGAFTFMQNQKNRVDWNEYIENYADFINRNKVEKFFELDIDSVVGYETVKKFRSKLEKLTGKKSIPVWHTSRGYEEFKRMADEYSYVAIGGIVSREIKPKHYRIFPQMINEAHKRGAIIHGLGFTNLEWIKTCKFDSVDSTAWTAGNRFGFVYKFDGQGLKKISVPKGKRLGAPKEVALNNFCEWCKYQKYAEKYL